VTGSPAPIGRGLDSFDVHGLFICRSRVRNIRSVRYDRARLVDEAEVSGSGFACGTRTLGTTSGASQSVNTVSRGGRPLPAGLGINLPLDSSSRRQ
jgi:hypothetical protein